MAPHNPVSFSTNEKRLLIVRKGEEHNGGTKAQ